MQTLKKPHLKTRIKPPYKLDRPVENVIVYTQQLQIVQEQ